MSGPPGIYDAAANAAYTSQPHYPPVPGMGPQIPAAASTYQPRKESNNSSLNTCGLVRQWVDRVLAYSSQYDSKGWSADSVVGSPKVYPSYGDNRGTWAQGVLDEKQFIELSYPERLFITEINIYETYHCGGVKSVYVRTPSGEWASVWSTVKAQCLENESRIFSVPLHKVQYRTNAIRLDIDCKVSNNWVEIDAVEMVGKKLPFDLPQPSDTVALHYRNFVNNMEFSDVTFKIQGQHIYGHRVILSARSQVFKQMFSTKTETNKPIELKDETVELFSALLKYLYTNELDPYLQPLQVTKLWRVAHRFQVEGLKSLIILSLSNALNIHNVIDIYAEASIGGKPCADHIRTMCIMYMSENMALVSRSPQFTKLPHNLMVDVIQSATGNL